MNRKLASALLVASAFQAQHVLALGVGEMTMHSALNEPLKAEIKLNDVGDLDSSQVKVGLASNKQFEEARIEKTFFLNDIKFVVDLEPNGNGVIKLSSHKRLNEPFLDFLLEVKWPTGQVLRSYTALVDLPVYMEAEPASVNISADKPKTQKPSAQKPAVTSREASTEVSVPVTEQQEAASSAQKTTDNKATSERTTDHAFSQTAEGEYFTQRNDTLWEIALEHRGQSRVSVQQVMIAIQRHNPDAFIAGNINRLKAGVKLQLPSTDKIQEMDRRQAINAVDAQNKQWRGAPLDATGASSSVVPSGSGSDEGHLRLSSSGSGSANGVDEQGQENATAAVVEQLERVQGDNERLESQVGSLNSQVDKLERLLELKSAELARLQQQLGEKPSGSAEAKAIEQELEAASQSVSEQAQELADAKAQGGDGQAQENTNETKTASPEQTETDKPQDEANKKQDAAPVANEKQAQEPSLFAKAIANPLYLGGLAIVIIAIAALVLLRRKSKAEQEVLSEFENFEFDELESVDTQEAQDEELEGEHEVAEEMAITAEADEDTSFDVDESQELAAEEGEEQGPVSAEDALNEADVYVAYGRFEQAQSLLQKALQQNPSNIALQAKLLQVFVESRDKQGFQEQYLALQAQGEQAELDKAKELLVASDETSTWLDDLPDISMSSDELELDLPDASDFEDDNAEITMIREGIELPNDDEGELSLEGEPELPVDGEQEAELDLDLDFDMSEELEDPSLEQAQEPVEQEQSFDLDDDLSLDLTGIDLDEPESESTDSSDDLDFSDLDLSLEDEVEEEGEALAQPVDESLEAESDQDDDFDISLDFDDAADELDLADGLDSAEEVEVDADADLGEEIDLDDFDLNLEEDDEPSLSLEESDSEQEEVELDDVEFSFEEEFGQPPEQAEAEASSLSDLEGDDFDFLTDADEISTKLDLAKAYVEMGDDEGARDILLEVVKEGNEQQKSEASDMLDGLE